MLFKFGGFGITVAPMSEALMAGPIDKAEGRHVVLIVDDERLIADTLSAIFRRGGYSVVTAYDGASGLALAESACPDLAITDVLMPGMSGVDLAILIQHAVPKCKILLFSGQGSTVDVLGEARALGYDFETMTKPVHPTAMLSRAAAWLEAA